MSKECQGAAATLRQQQAAAKAHPVAKGEAPLLKQLVGVYETCALMFEQYAENLAYGTKGRKFLDNITVLYQLNKLVDKFQALPAKGRAEHAAKCAKLAAKKK